MRKRDMIFQNGSCVFDFYSGNLLGFDEYEFHKKMKKYKEMGRDIKREILLDLEYKLLLPEIHSEYIIKRVIEEYSLDEEQFFENLELFDILDYNDFGRDERLKDLYSINYIALDDENKMCILSGSVLNMKEETSFKFKHYNLLIKKDELEEFVEKTKEELKISEEKYENSVLDIEKNIHAVQMVESRAKLYLIKVLKEEL